MGPKWGPNRIFDAEGVGNALGSLLDRSWSASEPKKTNRERLLGALEEISRQVSANIGVRHPCLRVRPPPDLPHKG